MTLPIGRINDVIVYAAVAPIDGPGKVLAFSGPCLVRSVSRLTVVGVMKFDSEDIDKLITNGTLKDVIQHEMLHIVGIGTLWNLKGLIAGAGTVDSRFTGALGIGACVDLNGAPVCSGSVPVENKGGPGTADGHWREATFGSELMTGFINLTNQYSTISIQSLADLGYIVNTAAADSYGIPGFSVQATRSQILADLSPAWEDVAKPKLLITREGRVSPIEKQ